MNSIYLVFSYPGVQRRLIQTKVCHKFLILSKKKTHKPLKVILCDNWKIMFFIKVYRYPEVLYNRQVLVLFETSDLY